MTPQQNQALTQLRAAVEQAVAAGLLRTTDAARVLTAAQHPAARGG